MATPKASKTPRRGKGRGRRVLVFLAALLFLILIVVLFSKLFGSCGAAAPENTIAARLEGVLGAGPSKEASLSGPHGLAVAANGDVYVADLKNSRVAVFGKDKAFKFAFGKPVPKGKPVDKAKGEEFSEPSAVALGPDGSAYVAVAWPGRVAKFDARGRFKAEYSGASYTFYSPRHVAVDAAGRLYVADTGNSQIKVIAPEGKLLKAFGTRGEGAGAFNEVFGVVLNSKGEVYAADAGNHRILKFSAFPELKYLAACRVPGWQAGSSWPTLACDREDRIYAMDTANRKVWIYDAAFKYLATLSLQGIATSQPLGLGFGPDGQLWVADSTANRLFKLAPFSLPAPAAKK